MTITPLTPSSPRKGSMLDPLPSWFLAVAFCLSLAYIVWYVVRGLDDE